MITHTYIITALDFPPESASAADILSQDERFCNAAFFDIETTGFSARKNAIYLIGSLRPEGDHWLLTQWLAEDKSADEQRAILNAFFADIAACTRLVTYNGATFDLPFIDKKCEALGLEVRLSHWEHLDLYKEIRKLNKLLKLESLKLKAVEAFLGIHREDEYSGGALIPIFETFTQSGNENLKQLLLLHNYEDIRDMLFILPMLAYQYLFTGSGMFTARSNITEQPGEGQLQLSITPLHPLPKPLPTVSLPFVPKNPAAAGHAADHSAAAGHNADRTAIDDPSAGSVSSEAPAFPGSPAAARTITLTVGTTEVLLNLPLLCAEMKFFYKDYKDYYYLPAEDCAIHKSVAGFVDKDHRRRATPKNCYTKKAGVFLPQPTDCFTPAFKEQYDDTLTWFEYDPQLLLGVHAAEYIQSFLRLFTSGSL